MKKKIAITFSVILIISFAVFLIKDWPDTYSIIKDIIGMLVSLVSLFVAIFSSSNDEVKQDNAYSSDHIVVVILDWFSLIFFILFICIYQFMNHNIVIGVIAIVALFNWALINLIEIVVNLVKVFKK